SYLRNEHGERVARRGGGGLATALRSLVAHHRVTWIASAMTEEDRIVAAEAGDEAIDETDRNGAPYRLRLVPHDPEAYDGFYNVVANPTLWFVPHYLFDLARAPILTPAFSLALDEGYVPVHGNFADAVLAELDRDPDGIVFLNDYHLYLTPRLVRERRPEATLAHFVHIPWPQPDYWRVLPEPVRTAIHDGLLANDLVGLHTARW